MSITRDTILDMVEHWIKQRPGLEFDNYGDIAAYRAEQRSIMKDKHQAEILLSAVRWRKGIDVPELRIAFRDAFCGRLSMKENIKEGTIILDYCIGQYWPTEYRRAACAVLASALWFYHRWTHSADTNPDGNVGNELRTYFRKEFGVAMQKRWFD